MASSLREIGEWPAFERLVQEQYGRLCACAFRYVGSASEAEDIVHDVLLRVWMQRARLTDVDLVTYLIQSVRNGAFSALRRRRSERTRDARVAGDRDPVRLQGADPAERAQIAESVTAAIAGLPERCQLIYLLHRDGGLTYPEIAQRLDLSVKTVETQMGRALKSLRLRLAPLLGLWLVLWLSG